MIKFLIILVSILSMLRSFPLTKRALLVDSNGFYLGGGSNSNIRAPFTMFDIGGPMVNPWFNAWTQPQPRNGVYEMKKVKEFLEPPSDKLKKLKELLEPPSTKTQQSDQPQQSQFDSQQQQGNENHMKSLSAKDNRKIGQVFTAVFVPGQDPVYKLGLPSDFAAGVYSQV